MKIFLPPDTPLKASNVSLFLNKEELIMPLNLSYPQIQVFKESIQKDLPVALGEEGLYTDTDWSMLLDLMESIEYKRSTNLSFLSRKDLAQTCFKNWDLSCPSLSPYSSLFAWTLNFLSMQENLGSSISFGVPLLIQELKKTENKKLIEFRDGAYNLFDLACVFKQWELADLLFEKGVFFSMDKKVRGEIFSSFIESVTLSDYDWCSKSKISFRENQEKNIREEWEMRWFERFSESDFFKNLNQYPTTFKTKRLIERGFLPKSFQINENHEEPVSSLALLHLNLKSSPGAAIDFVRLKKWNYAILENNPHWQEDLTLESASDGTMEKKKLGETIKNRNLKGFENLEILQEEIEIQNQKNVLNNNLSPASKKTSTLRI